MTLKDHRLDLGWSLAELARQAGVDVTTVRRAESGHAVFEHKAAQIVKAISEAKGQQLKIQDIEGLKIYS